ncbi:MAG: ATP-binding protein [Gammaproteobacteria bacterium]
MSSIKARLGAGLMLNLIVVFALQWTLVSLTVRRVTEDYAASRLQRDIEQLLAALSFGPAGHPVLPPTAVRQESRKAFSGHYYRIQTGAGVLRSRSLWDQDLVLPEAAIGAKLRLKRDGPLDQPLLIVVQGFSKRAVHVSIAVAEDMTGFEQEILDLQLTYLALSAGALILLLTAQTWAVRRALAPLLAIRVDLERLSSGASQSLSEDMPVEIKPLTHEINRLLELLGRRLKRSRSAISNLAHALKTPLSILQQSMRTPELDAIPELRDRMAHQISAVHRRIERELKRARMSGTGTSGTHFHVTSDLQGLIEVVKIAYADKVLNIELRGQSTRIWRLDREDLLELFGSLMDNACKWARRTVIIGIEDAVVGRVVIEDDGPGCEPERMSELGRRTHRLDESTAGHGLGLAIAGDIVREYAGHLEFDRSPSLGGLRVQVCMPAIAEA